MKTEYTLSDILVKVFSYGTSILLYAITYFLINVQHKIKPKIELSTQKRGGYAEYVAVDEIGLTVIPSTLSFQETVALSAVGLTAWQSLLRFGKLLLFFTKTLLSVKKANIRSG